MPLSEKALENKKKYNMKYSKEKIRRVPLDMQISEYEEIKNYVDAHGLTMNGFIKSAIRSALNK